jgi:EpsI family protein
MAASRFQLTSRLSNVDRSLVAVQGVSLAVLYFVFYWHLVPGLVNDWSTYEMFSHGFAVPFISGYLIWRNRGELQLLRISPTLSGSIPLGLIISLALAGEALENDFTMRLSMVLALAGSVYLLLGKGFLKALTFPLLYLVLMIPLPYIVMKELMYNLRVYISIYSEALLRIVAIPVYRDSYFLHLPNITLEVADGCSGVGSLFALFTLAVVYAYFLPISRTARLFLAISAVPVALFTNLFRIFVTAMLAYHIGPVALSSPIHYPYGAFNFVIGVGSLVFEGEFLRKRFSVLRGNHPQEKQMNDSTIGSSRAFDRWKPFVVGVTLFSLAIWSTGNFRAVPKAMAQVNLGEVTSSLERLYPIAKLDWVDPYEDRKADMSLTKVYVGAEQIPVEVFISYRNAQRAVNRLQSPKLTFPEGWYLVWVKPVDIEIDRTAKIKANWILTRKGMSQRLVLYWYQMQKLSFSGELNYRIELITRNILGRRTDGAVIRIATAMSDNEDVERAQNRLKSLAVNLYPRLVRNLH